MAYFDNLAFVLGGEDQIPDNFRSMYSEYDAVTRPPDGSTVYGSGPIQEAPVGPIGRERGLFGLVRDIFNDRPENPLTAGTGNVTVGAPQAGGLYGGNVQFNPGQSAYGSINPYSYMGDKKDGASELSAAVNRAQYQDYLNRFAPVENYAVGQIRGRNTADLGYDLARARQATTAAGVNLQGQQERAMGRFGLQYNGPNIANSNEVTGGQVAALNQARMADEDRTLGLVGGSAGGGNQ